MNSRAPRRATHEGGPKAALAVLHTHPFAYPTVTFTLRVPTLPFLRFTFTCTT